jgi:NADH:ubiquinone oxidoreductase subunit F (NADH-binding)
MYAVFFHPYYSKQNYENLEKLNRFIEDNSICAIGELDWITIIAKFQKNSEKSQ